MRYSYMYYIYTMYVHVVHLKVTVATKDLPEGHHQSQGCHLCHLGHHPWQHCHLCHQDECIEFRGDTKALRSRSVKFYEDPTKWKLIRQLKWFIKQINNEWTWFHHSNSFYQCSIFELDLHGLLQPQQDLHQAAVALAARTGLLAAVIVLFGEVLLNMWMQ